jgi:hypothetical protein
MDRKIVGAWLVHHTNKLQGITSPQEYEKTFLSGKAGILQKAISADSQMTIPVERLNVLARAAHINTTLELPTLLDVLVKRELIDKTDSGVSVLGVTTSSALQHTSDIFEAQIPTAQERAVIDLAERASIEPLIAQDVSEELSDIYQLDSSEMSQLMSDAEKIGFVDVEKLETGKSLLFNGNLFRRDTARKTKAVLDSLSSSDQMKLNEFTGILKKNTCIEFEIAKRQLGASLFTKVTAIGLFDVNFVSNTTENIGFLTLPSAFSKYSNSMIDDAFDLAKAFVSSITYGMTKSSDARGKIQMVDLLLSALVRGESVGPVQAIAEDYKILELKGVVHVTNGSKVNWAGKKRTGPMLRLLKKEVGELALQAIRQGDVSEHSLSSLPRAAVTQFKGPEHNRERTRRQQIQDNPKATNDMLSVLRTGGGL